MYEKSAILDCHLWIPKWCTLVYCCLSSRWCYLAIITYVCEHSNSLTHCMSLYTIYHKHCWLITMSVKQGTIHYFGWPMNNNCRILSSNFTEAFRVPAISSGHIGGDARILHFIKHSICRSICQRLTTVSPDEIAAWSSKHFFSTFSTG